MNRKSKPVLLLLFVFLPALIITFCPGALKVRADQYQYANIIRSDSVSGGDLTIKGDAWKDGYDQVTGRALKYLEIPPGRTAFSDACFISHTADHDMVVSLTGAYNPDPHPQNLSIITKGIARGYMGIRHVSYEKGVRSLYPSEAQPVHFKFHVDVFEAGTGMRAGIPGLYCGYTDMEGTKQIRFGEDAAENSKEKTAENSKEKSAENSKEKTAENSKKDSAERGAEIEMVLSPEAGIHILSVFAEKHIVSYKSVNGSVGTSREEVWEGLAPKGTLNTPDHDCHFVKWTADKEVMLRDGTVTAAGDALSSYHLKNAVITEDIVFTAINEKDPEIKYISDAGGVITGERTEYTAIGGSPTGTSEEALEGYRSAFWKSDKDLMMRDGSLVRAGTEMTYEQVLSAVITEDVIFEVFHMKEEHMEERSTEEGCKEERSTEEGRKEEGSTEEGHNAEESTEEGHKEGDAVPVLFLEETTDREVYAGNEPIIYTIRVGQTAENACATGIVIRDVNTKGLVFDLKSVIVSKGTVTTREETDVNGAGRQLIEVRIDRLEYGEEAIITFTARTTEELESGTLINKATAKCDELETELTDSSEIRVYYKVTTYAANGTISCSEDRITPGSVFRGEYYPEEGYCLTSVCVDGREMGISAYENEYVFDNIRGNHTLEVEYTEKTLPEIQTFTGKTFSGKDVGTLSNVKPVRTGDGTDIPFWYCIGISAVSGIFISVFIYRERI